VVFSPYSSQLGHFNALLSFEPPEDMPPVRTLTAQDLFEPATFREIISQWGAKLPTTDLKTAASLWSKQYNSIILYRALGLLTLGGIGIDSSLANLSLSLSTQEGEARYQGIGRPIRAIWHNLDNTVVYAPRCHAEDLTAQIERKAQSLDELYHFTFTNLFKNHFALVYEQIHIATKVSKKVLWGNLGAATAGLYHFLSHNLDSQPAFAEDNHAINQTALNPYISEGKNPLFNQMILETLDDPAFPEPLRLRQTCCLWYKVPEMQMCLTCPLEKPETRQERWKTYFANQADH
jgi:ferric iron reductase protein FhuF